MKTYHVCLFLLVLLINGCNSSEEIGDTPEILKSVDVDYTLLLDKGEAITTLQLNANLNILNKNPTAGLFTNIASPELINKDGLVYNYYKRNTDCSGVVTRYDFENDVEITQTIFTTIIDCNTYVKALVSTKANMYIAYKKINKTTAKEEYSIRVVSLEKTEANYVDVVLEKEPLQLLYSNDKLFVLLKDTQTTSKNALLVMNSSSKELIHELNLGEGVQKITKNSNGDILVNYETYHVIIDAKTLITKTTVRYNATTNPKMGVSKISAVDTSKLYYAIASELSNHPSVPAVYDYEANTLIIYVYENFLTEEERKFKYDIGETTMVSYDKKNNLILIGYKKTTNPKEGGLLRIKPAPDPKFIDQIDLTGVPTTAFVK